jgi:hypothetical protein
MTLLVVNPEELSESLMVGQEEREEGGTGGIGQRMERLDAH